MLSEYTLNMGTELTKISQKFVQKLVSVPLECSQEKIGHILVQQVFVKKKIVPAILRRCTSKKTKCCSIVIFLSYTPFRLSKINLSNTFELPITCLLIMKLIIAFFVVVTNHFLRNASNPMSSIKPLPCGLALSKTKAEVSSLCIFKQS